MLANNHHYLTITAMGNDNLGILEAFTKMAKECAANIVDGKLKKIGSECALFFYLSGTWSAIAKLEVALPQLAQQYDLNIQTKRTQPRLESPALPYHVQVTALDEPGILNDVALFFTRQQINIDQMEMESYSTKNQTMMINISMLVNIPAKKHIASLREKFMIYCEDRNLDAILEPFKGV